MRIEAENLSRTFGATPVLKQLNLTVESGESVAILGANGAGKTTLLRILATLTTPTAGEVRIGGVSVARDARRARALIGWVPATDGGFFPRFNGRDNLFFFGHLRGVGKKEVERAIGLLSGVAPFGEALTRPYYLCSSGMKQALAIGRALVGDPPVLLMDEPTRYLDAGATRAVKEILAGARKTAVFATHANGEVGLHASRRIAIEEGRAV
jgi:ABC-type multidrug transport system ATPase subunit